MPLGIETMFINNKSRAKFRLIKRHIIHIVEFSCVDVDYLDNQFTKTREAWDLEGTSAELYTGGTPINPINE